MMRAHLAAALALALLAAGCLAPDASAPDGAVEDASRAAAPAFDGAGIIEPDHADHVASSAHEKGHDLALVGHASLADALPPGIAGSISSIDVLDGWAVVAGVDGGLAFALVDLRDPAAPVAVSSVAARSHGWGARFSADGDFVFYACTLITQYFAPVPVSVPAPGECDLDAAARLPAPLSSRILVYDVKDRAAPKFVTSIGARGTHNLNTALIDGEQLVVTDAAEIFRWDNATGTMEKLSEVPGLHDASVARHPVTGQWLLYTGAGGGGFAIYDVDDPRNPSPVFSGVVDGAVGWHEQTPFPEAIDGRALLALGGETIESPGGLEDHVSIVDITDPTNPTLVGTWAPPFSPSGPWVQYQWSLHEMAATPDGHLAVAWYHAGVWVLDATTMERAGALGPVAAYQPHEPGDITPARFPLVPVPTYPNVWGVGWDARGLLVVPDMHSGVYVLEPEWADVRALDSGQ